jgi:hypothetical protein
MVKKGVGGVGGRGERGGRGARTCCRCPKALIEIASSRRSPSASSVRWARAWIASVAFRAASFCPISFTFSSATSLFSGGGGAGGGGGIGRGSLSEAASEGTQRALRGSVRGHSRRRTSRASP